MKNIGEHTESRKPTVLFHGSQNRNIDVFEPRKITFRDENEGPIVFATPSKVYASCFVVPTNDSWVQIGAFNDTRYYICNDEKRFFETDLGGAIYSLPSDTFTIDLSKHRSEWTSIVPVIPIRKKEYDKGLDTMVDNFVQVYFVDNEIFLNIANAGDHGFSILRKIESYNQKIGKGVKRIDE